MKPPVSIHILLYSTRFPSLTISALSPSSDSQCPTFPQLSCRIWRQQYEYLNYHNSFNRKLIQRIRSTWPGETGRCLHLPPIPWLPEMSSWPLLPISSLKVTIQIYVVPVASCLLNPVSIFLYQQTLIPDLNVSSKKPNFARPLFPSFHKEGKKGSSLPFPTLLSINLQLPISVVYQNPI
jgi:hypothetical protein